MGDKDMHTKHLGKLQPVASNLKKHWTMKGRNTNIHSAKPHATLGQR
jgi:hypothetical protein